MELIEKLKAKLRSRHVRFLRARNLKSRVKIAYRARALRDRIRELEMAHPAEQATKEEVGLEPDSKAFDEFPATPPTTS